MTQLRRSSLLSQFGQELSSPGSPNLQRDAHQTPKVQLDADQSFVFASARGTFTAAGGHESVLWRDKTVSEQRCSPTCLPCFPMVHGLLLGSFTSHGLCHD